MRELCVCWFDPSLRGGGICLGWFPKGALRFPWAIFGPSLRELCVGSLAGCGARVLSAADAAFVDFYLD